MASSVWLDLSSTRSHATLLQYHHAFASIQQELAFPDVQEPQLIAMIGGEVKSSLMRDIFAVKPEYGHNRIHLRLAPDCVEALSPILLADCELHALDEIKKDLSSNLSRHFEQHRIRWISKIPHAINPNILAQAIYIKLIMPFSTIICLFADDLGGTKGVAKLLASWLLTVKYFRSPELPPSTYPRILVLQRWQDVAATFDEKLATIALMQEVNDEFNSRKMRLGNKDRLDLSAFGRFVKEQFGDIRMLPLPKSSGEIISFHPYLNKIQRRLLHESADVQALRKTAKVSFSTHHFAAFFNLALKHFVTTNTEAFSFVEASRTFNPLPKHLAKNLSNFLEIVAPEYHITFAVPVIASALCLDSLTPGMHCE